MNKKQIVIDTDEAGFTLYNSNIENGRDELNHIDRLNSYNNLIDQLKKINPKSIDHIELIAFKDLLNLGALLSIARLDMLMITTQLYLSKHRSQQLFYSKHAYLVIYETFTNLKAKQKNIKSYAMGTNKEINIQHDQAFKNWSKFINEYKVQTNVKEIRNNIIGHIEKDFTIWHKTALSLDHIYTLQMIVSFMNSLNQLQNLATLLVNHYHTKLLHKKNDL